LHRKIIYWGHGRDLLDNEARIKNLAYAAQHAMSDAIILYAEHLKNYVPHCFHKKVFIANNTLYFSYRGLKPGRTRESVLAEYGIRTKLNIICVGRMQKRKRIENLVEAIAYMKRSDVGLILVGPDPDGVLNKLKGNTIYKLGPIYGDRKYDLLSSSDVYCLPGPLGLSIVDAFYCGLPIVTEDGDVSPEIMYLKDGINGFIVPRGDVCQLASKLQLLLNDELLRKRFSTEAMKEIKTNGHIDKMSKGFSDALLFAFNKQT
jgi:glycosyltransferase involved in cell wall biosynthesis